MGGEQFGAATREWFSAAFAGPTPAQIGAWQAIAAGRHALVVAPTGSGKTLAAFLWSLDRLARTPPPAEPLHRCRVLYVSPLKALAVDVERNLRAPLTGIRHAAARLGLPVPDITVGMRTGDTPPEQRRSFARRPSDILITTPESLFLLLTSSAREALRGVDTVIVDEVHAVAATKRGAHLALSLERLDALLPRPAQRIGLSATVRPVPEVARFLGGAAPVAVIQPPAAKSIDVSVQVPVPDMTDLAAGNISDEADPEAAPRASMWPAIEQRVFELVRAHRSTIVFTNGRRSAERLCSRLNEIAAGAPPPDVVPAEVMAQSGRAGGAPPVIARAHHGSVSKEERKRIEEALKSGALPAVVATSSLELGIDMGAVDLVVQVEAPPSVAAGLQRVGRAGHQVGAVSTGVVLPTHRGDLLSCAVVAQRMGAGEIEQLRYPRNPLDVLAQQVVAMVAMDTWRLADLATMVRRAAPFAELPDSALTGVLDMLSGRYPSTSFAELRPRLVWDRHTDLLTGRRGAQHLAVTSGGTIPDRGLFGVFLAGADKPVRVGELDEEMVYESRLGDVFLLGSTSWRIEDITPDRVLVSPAPGQAARMPFWKGDAPGRPLELGRAIGARLRALHRMPPEEMAATLRGDGLDAWAADNLTSYLTEQRHAVRAVPDDRTVVVERFRDELGDWRLAVHCVLGAKVNAPWALAIGHRLQQRYGMDAQVLPSDDGIVVRLPEMLDGPPGAELVGFDPDEVAAMVEETVGGSALFAARFRECAARSLLLPRRDPRRRQPLWQQRQRAAQLLDVAREFADFPITLEAARECLQDVFDLPGLVTLMRELAGRQIRLVEVETPQPSPFARSLLFGYVGAFLYEGDAPLAERRAAALALDSTLLGELLGRVDLRELLDPEVIAATERQLQWLPEPGADTRRVRDTDDTAELLRVLGDLSAVECEGRGVDRSWLHALHEQRRVLQVRVAGEPRWIVVEDAGRYAAALGVALPPGVPQAHATPTDDPLGDLVIRFARTRGPFDGAACAARFGLPLAVVDRALRQLAAAGRVLAGEFTPAAAGAQWCDADVLRLLRRRSLAALRREIEPVAPEALASFLPRWQQVGAGATGVAAVAAAVGQLQPVPVPASALEQLILPARVADYTPSYLDELCASGEVTWCGAGAIGSSDGWVVLSFADTAPLLQPAPDEALALTAVHEALLESLDGGQAFFFRTLVDRVGAALPETPDDATVAAAVWDLVWAGHLSNDTLAPLRAMLAGGAGVHRRRPTAARTRYATGVGRAGWHRPRVALPARGGPPTMAGRWHRLPNREPDATRRATALAESLLDRHGVVTRTAVAVEGIRGGFAGVYPVLAAMEERGAIRRGYFVDGLGAAQFAAPGAVDRLRAEADPTGQRHRAASPLVLAATDPANPYGAALPWPERPTDAGGDTVPTGSGAVPHSAGHRAGRKAGALVVLVSGTLALYVERGGRTLLSYTSDVDRLSAAAKALADAVHAGALGGLSVERADGAPLRSSALHEALTAAGFRVTPRGLRLRG
jgi:ATP-dependent helicase Lhr and Lhr-like helicase